MSQTFALVTGTSSGVGAATARLLLDRGWFVVGVSRRAAEIDHANYHHLALDLADVDAVPLAIERHVAPMLTSKPWQRVGLVNNAARADLLMPFNRLQPRDLMAMLALNTVTPIWLMGFILRTTPAAAALRIANVSTGGAVKAFPGLAAYCTSKAALRMAGEVVATELDPARRVAPGPTDVAIFSYQPGTVDTRMQTEARTRDEHEFPWGQLFRDFHAKGMLVSPDRPAAEIVAFLESESAPLIEERRLSS